MSSRVHNFCAGPCILPLSVLEEVQAEFVDYHGAGMSLIEMSHRGGHYDEVHAQARALALEVYGAPEDFDVLFVQGGATLQFAMVPMNLLAPGCRGAYALTGTWARGAFQDAAHCGEVYAAWDGAEEGYRRAPASHEIRLQEDTCYLHITSNETIGGIRYAQWPEAPVPLVADMSSDFMSRPIPWARFDLVYGGVQKNLGPAGMAMVFLRRALLDEARESLARYLRFDVHQKSSSLFNTPPVFTVYVTGKVLRWMKDKGGLEVIEREAREKAELLYGVIDSSDGYYSCPVDTASRSHMNVVFRLPSEELEAKFLGEADARGFVNLKGHRSVGGCRASLYNAMPRASVEALCDFMDEFRDGNR